jgi:branched-chain amino acid transport system permease protein
MQRLESYITQDRRYISIAIGFVVILFFAILPAFIDVEKSYWAYFLFLTFIYITVSQGWNLVAGYAGQISLGTHAFFGLGAYTMALIWLHDLTHTGYYFDPLLMILAGIVPVVLAIIIGIPLLSRLRGDSFAFGTLGVGFILTVVFTKLRTITGGADGLHIPSAVYSSMVPYYYSGLLLALFSIGAVYFITRSRIGLALRAVREDETSAASHGVPILWYKVFAFAAAAFLAGIAGSLWGYYLFHINPQSVMNLNWLFYPGAGHRGPLRHGAVHRRGHLLPADAPHLFRRAHYPGDEVHAGGVDRAEGPDIRPPLSQNPSQYSLYQGRRPVSL